MDEAKTIREKAKRRLQDLASHSWLKNLILIVVFGAALGAQISNPNKRFIEAVIGLAVVVLLWNYSTLAAVWIILVMYPFPFAIKRLPRDTAPD